MIGQEKTTGCLQPKTTQMAEGGHSSKSAGNLSEIRMEPFKYKYSLSHDIDFQNNTKHVIILF
jgi:hypothetical protein